MGLRSSGLCSRFLKNTATSPPKIATANTYRAFGLTEYEAMKAFMKRKWCNAHTLSRMISSSLTIMYDKIRLTAMPSTRMNRLAMTGVKYWPIGDWL